METSIEEHDNQAFAQHGWYAHIVPSGDNTPYGFNYHTHGMEKSYNHLNIQIVMPLSPHIAHEIVSDLIEEIKAGKKFEINKDYPDVVGGGYMVRFIEAHECGRKVLRLLVPDKFGKYEGDFARQLDYLDTNDDLAEDEKVHQED